MEANAGADPRRLAAGVVGAPIARAPGAQEAARAVALADDWDQGVATGSATVQQLASNHGVDPGDVSVSFAGSLDRGGAVTATTTVSVPALAVPYIVTVPTFELSFAHTETVDAYRSFPP